MDFGLDLGRLLLKPLGVRLQLFAAETSRIAARRVEPLEFELEQRAQVAVGVRGGDVLHDAALDLALGRIWLEIRMQLLDEPAIDGAQAVLPQLLLMPGLFLCAQAPFGVGPRLVRGAAGPFGAAEIVCQPSGGSRGVLFRYVRAQLRELNIKPELIEHGGHPFPHLLDVVLHPSLTHVRRHVGVLSGRLEGRPPRAPCTTAFHLGLTR